MFKKIILFMAVLWFAGDAFATDTSLDCKLPKLKGAFNAVVKNDGTMNRSIEVTFKTTPAPSVATTVVQACVKSAVASNSSIDALGAAWVGEAPVRLSGGKSYFAYVSDLKKYKFM
ncbi:MAG: hypothetical protein K2P84_08170 [Undibacterium sp.]|nr:hypothetical protein [Undibacterium sp.]